MGAGGSVDANGVERVLEGISSGDIPDLDTQTLRPYLQKFLRMRKSRIPAGACYQAAVLQLRQDGVDVACLAPLEAYLEKRLVEDEKSIDAKSDGNYAHYPDVDYIRRREGPSAEELLGAFGVTEEELKAVTSSGVEGFDEVAEVGSSTPDL